MIDRTNYTIDEDVWRIVDEFRALREGCNIGQKVLAFRIGSHQPVISRLENKLHEPKLSILIRCLRVLGYRIKFEKISDQKGT